MSKTYDVIVIGSGTAATTVAKRVSAAGRSVAVTDFRPYGGTSIGATCWSSNAASPIRCLGRRKRVSPKAASRLSTDGRASLARTLLRSKGRRWKQNTLFWRPERSR